MSPIVDSISALIGDTPCIPLSTAFETSRVYLKLEGFNPTGSIYDRFILHATLQGQNIAITASSPVCASVALLGAVLQVPVIFDPQDSSRFTSMAEALGAARASDIPQNIQFDTRAVLYSLIREIKSEVTDVKAILVPKLPLLPTQIDKVDDVHIQWISPSSSFLPERSELSQRGILIDEKSAYCVHIAKNMREGVTVVVCAIDGAIALAEMEEKRCL